MSLGWPGKGEKFIAIMRVLVPFVLVNFVVTNAEKVERKDQRIVGGDPAPEGRFPYYAHYASKACGATLIHDDILVSAAHCCGYSDCGVRLDSIEKGEGTYIEIDEYVIHPGYTFFGFSDDIMIMKLKEASSVSPIGYNTNGAVPTDDQELTTIGYGATSEGGSTSDELLQVTVNYVPHDECSDLYSGSYSVNRNTMLCAAAPGRDSCQGDSGGPIFDAADGTGDIVGIVSWGDGCAREEPGVYTRISHYEEWIENAICCMSDNPPNGCTCGGGLGDRQTCQVGLGSSAGCATLSGTISSSSCLSPDATTMVETKGKVSMKDIVVGDKVMTASGEYKPVFTISHSHPDEPTAFLKLETDMDENSLEVTPLHLVFLHGKHTPVPAKDVKMGDFLQTLQGPKEVISITTVTRNGFYNPVTTDGTILVDGIIASTYTSMNGGTFLEIAGVKLISFQSLFDITISPYRAFCTAVSHSVCSRLGGKHDDKPSIVYLMMQFYEFWLRQTVTVQLLLFFVYIMFFGLANVMLGPVGIILLAACAGVRSRLASVRMQTVPCQHTKIT